MTVAVLSCSTSNGPAASSARTASPGLALNPGESKAADFRTRLDLLLGEHVIAIAKESSATGRPDEYTSYLRVVTSNGNDLTDLIRSALGDSAAASFDKIWSTQNDNFVNYAIGLVTHNKSKSNSAMSSLASTFVPQFSQFLTATTQLPLDPITQLTTQHVLETKAMIDDQFTKNYPRLYADLHLVYGQASRIGDAVANQMAQKFRDKFPGDPSSKAVDLRVSMNNLLQEHLYIATMMTGAAAGGRSAEQAAASGSLAESSDALGTLFADLFGQPVGTRFDEIWAAKDAATLAYAAAATESAKQSALGRLSGDFVTQFSSFLQDVTGVASGNLRPAIATQVQATLAVIDDQRAKSATTLGADDRSAGASSGAVADIIASAAVTKLRSRFGS